MKLPEDSADWDEDLPFWCVFYVGRDCPGCLLECSRFKFTVPGGYVITDADGLPQRRWPNEV